MFSKKVFIIAEAGVNHDGKLEKGFQLIDAAVMSGADAIKFQTFKTEDLIIPGTEKLNYQKDLRNAESQFEMLKKLELSEKDFISLKKYADKRKIIFMSTGFDLHSIKFLSDLNLNIFKIPSGEINNVPLVRAIGQKRAFVILSTGMSNMKEIKFSVDLLVSSGTKKENIKILHCTSEYPAKLENINLLAISTIKSKLKMEVGYSDHSNGIEVSIAAVALGAKVIEKHLTINKNDIGPDHKASLDPNEFKQLFKR